MLYYILFWTLLVFIIHFYIIFGTNLLTGGPAQNCCFFAYFRVSQKKNIKRSQTEWNLRERSFWNKRDPEDLECKSISNRGGHEGGGRAPYLVGPSGVHWPTSSSYIYPRTPRTSKATMKNYFHHHNLLYPRDPILEPSPMLGRRGIDHGGLLHQHHSPSDELWVVYHRPSGP